VDVLLVTMMRQRRSTVSLDNDEESNRPRTTARRKKKRRGNSNKLPVWLLVLCCGVGALWLLLPHSTSQSNNAAEIPLRRPLFQSEIISAIDASTKCEKTLLSREKLNKSLGECMCNLLLRLLVNLIPYYNVC
jgi:hypothetical protein